MSKPAVQSTASSRSTVLSVASAARDFDRVGADFDGPPVEDSLTQRHEQSSETKKVKDALVTTLVHGDMLIFLGDDFNVRFRHG
jgi:hypothetical protein